MRCNRLTRLPAGSLLAVTLLLGGCSLTADKGPTVDYRNAENAKSLEVPPDLTRPESRSGLTIGGSGSGGATTASTSGSGVDGGGSGNSGLLPEFDNVRFVRAGASSWLEVEDAPPDDIWPRVDRFLESRGLPVERREPALGIIETGWADRQDGPESGGLTGFFNSALGGLTSDNLRDRYNLRLERMEDGGTRVFVAHQMAQEIDAQSDTRMEADFEWVRRRGDPSIEAEMARRLLVYLGVSEERSDTIVAQDGVTGDGAVDYEVDSGAARIRVADRDARRVFVRVGDALVRIGAEVRDSDRERGVYQLDWRPPEGSMDSGGGFFGLFGGGEPESRSLELRLYRESDGIEILAADEGGDPRSGDVHRALLREVAIAMGADEDRVRAVDDDAPDSPDDGDYTAPDGPQL